jgi:hypothetical protein
MLTLTGPRIEVPLSEVVDLTLERSFRGAVRLGRQVMVLHLEDGNRVGFFVADQDIWRERLWDAAASARRRSQAERL